MTIRRALEPADYPFFDYRRLSFSLGIAAAGRIWLSGSTAVRHEQADGMVVRGDLVSQASTIFDKMSATLAAAKRGLADVERITRFITPAALPSLPALDVFQTTLLRPNVSVTTQLVHSLLRQQALIEIEGVAADGAADGVAIMPSVIGADRKTAWSQAEHLLKARGIGPERLLKATEFGTPKVFGSPATSLHANALRVGVPRLAHGEHGVQIDMAAAEPTAIVVYAALEADAALDGIVNQCRDLYARLGESLVRKGASLDSVVKTTEFIVPSSLSDYRGTAQVRRDVFSAPYPAATGVICEQLSTAGALIAVEAIALRGA